MHLQGLWPDVVVRNRQAGQNLAPNQLSAPDVADEGLDVDVAANPAGKSEKCRIGVEERLPASSEDWQLQASNSS